MATSDKRPSHDNDNDNEYIIDQLERLLDRAIPLTADTSVHKGEQLTFTLPQIATGLFALITFVGAILGAWGTLNSQIASQKVSTDLTIEQMQKDITLLTTNNKDTQSKIDSITNEIQVSIKELTARVAELDNTVNQLYNRNNVK